MLRQSLTLLCLQTLSLVSTSAGSIAGECLYPTGLEVFSDLSNVPQDGIFASFIVAGTPPILAFETPIQFRAVEMSSLLIFNCMAAFEPTSLDHFGRIIESNHRRRCKNSTDFDIQRRITLAYCLYYAFDTFIQSDVRSTSYQSILDSYGLDVDICDRDDIDCSDISTPYGLAYTLLQEVIEFSSYDGWNADGSLSRDYNKIPYQDFRPNNGKVSTRRYIPENDPWKLSNPTKWQPLLESDNLGFLFYQQHVTPHIGFTAKSILLGDDNICIRKAPKPKYNYYTEMDLTIDRLSNLTDKQKMEIELFDNKFESIVPLVAQYFVRTGRSLDSFDFIFTDFIINNVLYESTIIVWKEKIIHNAVRPPSIIQSLLKGQIITSYGGTTLDGEPVGTQTFDAHDWEPYIRTMPHAEYPSASACVCEAFKTAVILATGVDDFTDQIGGPLIIEIPKGSSRREPGFTPQEDLILEYSSWSEISEVCGQSRLDGGMHFTASVPNGANLCSDVGELIYNAFVKLVNGEVPENIVDINDKTIPQRTCDKKKK